MGEHLFGESYTLSQTPFQGVAWTMQSTEPELVDGLEGSLWVLCSWRHRELMSDPPLRSIDGCTWKVTALPSDEAEGGQQDQTKRPCPRNKSCSQRMQQTNLLRNEESARKAKSSL